MFRVESGLTHADVIAEMERVMAAIAAGDGEAASRQRVADFRAGGERVVTALTARGML